jgi:flagellar protein FlaG
MLKETIPINVTTAPPRTADLALPASKQPTISDPVSEENPSLDDTMTLVAQQIEVYLRNTERALEFRIDSASGRTVISVRDAETGDLIRQIPAEEALRLSRSLHDGTNALLDLTA